MKFSKRKNCFNCGYPLHLQDLKNSQWIDNVQEFNFICSSCNSNNYVKFSLFDKNGHVNRSYIAILKDDKEYISGERLTNLFNHINSCDECKKRLNEEYIADVEEKIRFNERSLLYFIRHADDVYKELINYKFENDHVKYFKFEDKSFVIKEDDEFYRDDDRCQICYYLRNEEQCLLGMVCFSIFNKEKVVLDKIWFRSEDNLKKEQHFFNLLKEEKIKLRLETIEKIFKTLQN